MPSAPQVARTAGQLPVEITGFVGRRPELAVLESLLAGSRLVTITGAGGVGKTRLALRAASRTADRYRHGVVLAELSGLRDAELLPHAVASALGLTEQDPRPRAAAIADYLRERQLLLVLDTCEHLIDACAVFAEAMLREAPEVTILATSRQPLDIPGESTFPLGPLQVPEPGAAPAPGDAVELFAQRAAAASAGFRVTAANQAQVVQLCRRLDGIPLAIELAAVRLRVLGIDELTRRLDRRLRLLAGGRRGTATRHQALRDTIGWSYELCTPGERALWTRLSVFAGPFSVQAAEDTCADDIGTADTAAGDTATEDRATGDTGAGDTGAGGELPRDAILGTLISLVDKSVLMRDDGPAPCYRMLDTIREYGAERLDKTSGADRVTERMAKHYLRLAEELNADPLTDQLPRYQTLRAQHASVMAALDRALALPGLERTAARLVMALYWYVEMSGVFAEARHYLAKARERFPGPSAARAGVLTLHGLVVTAQGDPAAGLAECEEGLEMATALGMSRIRARGQLYYCQALIAAGRPAEAIAAGLAAREAMTQAGDTATAEALWLYLGIAYLLTGDIDAAHASCAQGLRRRRPGGGERWLSSFLYVLSACVLALRGEHEQAASALRESLAMRRELGDPMGIAYCLGLLGYAAAGQGRHADAAWLMGAAAPLWESLGTEPFTGVPGIADLVGAAEADARQALGAAVWDKIFAQGAACPLEEAVTLAVRGGDLPSRTAEPATATPLTTGPPATGTTGAGQAAGLTRAGLAEAGPEAEGMIPLTRREREIAGLIAGGLSNREVAERLVISKRTVDSHVEHIFGKLRVSSRVQLALWVQQYSP